MISNTFTTDQILKEGKVGGMEYTVKGELHEIPGTNGKAFAAEAYSLRTKKKFWIGWLDITKKKDPFSTLDFLSDKSEEALIKEMELKKRIVGFPTIFFLVIDMYILL